MKKEEIPKKLRNFLVEKGFIKKYINNCKNFNYSGIKQILKKFKDSPDILQHSFIWGLTKEGYVFWSELDSEFQSYFYDN